ncbi:post-segregation killing protein PndC [Mixta mediterraneensis]|uniref:post-segregation killing protein PndC n=1 Tax=Mixta mediterraneensis TaxID=2758443 RepID=UPI0018762C6D|nr:post-segregation killing protein PndC [Mixta mediterraneensis]MBE5253482.1 post-segregation killing protein PndC [Mixta mediterraneensis]
MATRSNINVKVGDIYHCVYCHWDGYPEHHGPILTAHYNSQELAEKLVSHGDISILDNSCDKPEGHSFDNRVDGYTVYYGRDRGEENVSFKKKASPLNQEEFSYIWDGEKWLVMKGNERTKYPKDAIEL